MPTETFDQLCDAVGKAGYVYEWCEGTGARPDTPKKEVESLQRLRERTQALINDPELGDKLVAAYNDPDGPWGDTAGMGAWAAEGDGTAPRGGACNRMEVGAQRQGDQLAEEARAELRLVEKTLDLVIQQLGADGANSDADASYIFDGIPEEEAVAA